MERIKKTASRYLKNGVRLYALCEKFRFFALLSK